VKVISWSQQLQQRRRQPEIMDEPGLDRDRHAQALRALERINFWSGSVGILWRPIRQLLHEAPGRPLRVLDMACGAGDVPIGLWKKAARAGSPLIIEGWDVSATAVEYACRRASERKADVRFVQGDVLTADIIGNFDVVVCSLFLHHLDEQQAVVLLQRMAQTAARLVLVNDLARCAAGFLVAKIVTRLLTSSTIVRTDGPRSVEAAFTPEEALMLAERAGLAGAVVARRWPCRILLSWERSWQ
jgi:2-polyprenyl-3-methyl-5-hydroxy-6-metoxy-1,4-benzoquinol methylase